MNETCRRRGVTLIELLVVLGIIGFLAVLGYLVLPDLFKNFQRTRGTDTLSQWLLVAKQQAKRDGVPTGVRFLDPNNPTINPVAAGFNPANIKFTQVQYIQQPDPY